MTHQPHPAGADHVSDWLTTSCCRWPCEWLVDHIVLTLTIWVIGWPHLDVALNSRWFVHNILLVLSIPGDWFTTSCWCCRCQVICSPHPAGAVDARWLVHHILLVLSMPGDWFKRKGVRLELELLLVLLAVRRNGRCVFGVCGNCPTKSQLFSSYRSNSPAVWPWRFPPFFWDCKPPSFPAVSLLWECFPLTPRVPFFIVLACDVM